jgi:hypothetical protein
MAKYLIIGGISCDLIEVLSWNLLRGTEENYEFLRIASMPARIQNWYPPNTARNMYVYTRLIDWSTCEKCALHYYYYYYFMSYCSVNLIVGVIHCFMLKDEY